MHKQRETNRRQRALLEPLGKETCHRRAPVFSLSSLQLFRLSNLHIFKNKKQKGDAGRTAILSGPVL